MTNPYDEVAYLGRAFSQTHPDRLAVQARLRGLEAPDPTACRVLEIGCGDGGNLVPMACELPGSEFVGVDLAAGPIARAEAFAAGAGAANARFVQADLRQIGGDLGDFDYVIAHGVYSWVPPDARTALLELVRRRLTPTGVAFVSYNAYPGSYLRDMAADVLRYHLRHGDVERLGTMGSARELMELVVRAGVDTPHARVLADEMRALLGRPDWSTLHDELAASSAPFYFHEFADHAAQHELAFLGEAHVADSRLPGLPDDVARALAGLPADVVMREQYLDIVKNRSFRQTLLRHGAAAPTSHAIDPARLEGMWAASPARRVEHAATGGGPGAVRFSCPDGTEVATSEPALVQVLDALGAAWPGSVHLDGLTSTGESGHVLASALLEAHAARAVDLHVHPPRAVATPGERPVAPATARWQAANGDTEVTSALHAPVRLEDALGRALLTLLDGTRDRAALAAQLATRDDAARVPDLPAALDASLDALAQLGLLVAPGAG